MNEAFVKAEILLTGIALSDKQKANDVFEMVDPNLFSYQEIKELFLKARSHWTKNGSLDYDAFSLFLSADEQNVAETCRNFYAPSLDPKELAQAFIDEVSVDRAKNIADRLRSINSADEIADYIGELQGITKGVTPMKSMTFSEYMANFVYSKTQPVHYIETGYPQLDRDVLIDRGDFVILTGEQSAGKTAFSVSLAIAFAKQGYKIAYFSLETSADGIFDRGTAIYSGVKFGNLLRKKLTEDDFDVVGNKFEELNDLSIEVFECAGATVEQIKRKALEVKAEIIFIDYVGLMKGKGESVYDQYTSISVDLHTLAQSERIAVVALAQKNREGNKTKDDSMHSIIGSGQFESDADLILNIVNKEDRQGKDKWQTTIHISKNKKGKVDSIDMWFDGETQRFTELTEFEKAQAKKPVAVRHDVLKM